MIDLLQIEGFLSPEACAELRAELRRAAGSAATLLGREGIDAVQPHVRRTTRAAIPPATRERMTRLLTDQRDRIADHFGVLLGECEEPQFLRYRTGDFFVAHQDGNTPLLFDESRWRRISTVIFLSSPSEDPAPHSYGGGLFVFHGPWSDPSLRLPLAPPSGTLLCFRAETTHEVTPVTHGERLTIVSWFRGADAPDQQVTAHRPGPI